MTIRRAATDTEYSLLSSLTGMAVHRFWDNHAVTPDGRIWSLTRVGWRERLAAPWNGYLFVRRAFGGRQKAQTESIKVHRLVAEAFIGPPPFPGAVIRHLNDVKTDNRVENLAWGTISENYQDAVRNGRINKGEKASNLKRNRCTQAARRLAIHQAREVRRRFLAGGIRAVDLAREFSISKTHVYRIAKGLYCGTAALREHLNDDEADELVVHAGARIDALKAAK